MEAHTHPINDSVQENLNLSLLGMLSTEVISMLGVPKGRYDYRGREVLMFGEEPYFVSVEVKNGYVVSVNTHQERRSNTRIKPYQTERAILRHSGKEHEAEIIDLSVKGIAMKVTKGTLPAKGATVSFCASLKTRPFTIICITLVGRVHRVVEEKDKIVILFSTSFETHSHKALVDYINSHQALSAIRHVAPQPTFSALQLVERNMTIIKSDLCIMCREKSCGASLDNEEAKFLNDQGITDHAA